MKLTCLLFLLHSIVPVSRATSPTCGDDLNADSWQCVALHMDLPDRKTLATFSKATQKGAVRAHSIKKYVEGMPSYVQAMRRCMVNDDVKCYHAVRGYFQESKPWRINQLPALAAQMGAKKIFLELGYNETDSRWEEWMERAKKHSGTDFRDDDFVQRLDNGDRVSVYSAVLDYEVRYQTDRSVTILDKLIPSRKRPGRGIPSAYELVSILRLPKGKRKAKRAETMKKILTKLLETGTYILEDTLKAPSVTWTLWYFHASDEGKDRVSTQFVEWLIQEGAPIDERELMLRYNKDFLRGKVKPMPEPYKDMLKSAVKYSSGTPTRSLTYLFETMGLGHFDIFLNDIPRALDVYWSVFHQDLDYSAPSLLRALAYFLSTPKPKRMDDTARHIEDDVDTTDHELALFGYVRSWIANIYRMRIAAVYVTNELRINFLETFLEKFTKANVEALDPSHGKNSNGYTFKQRVTKGIHILEDHFNSIDANLNGLKPKR